MKRSLFLSTALVVLGLAATAAASPPGAGAPSSPPVARAAVPTTPRDTGQIQRAALTSFRRSPLAREGIVGRPSSTTVRIQQPASGLPVVTAVVDNANGWRALGGKAGRAQFHAVKTVDPKTGETVWKLAAIKTSGRVWQRIHTLEPFAAPP